MKKIVSLFWVGLLVSGTVFAREVEKSRKNMAVTWNPLERMHLPLVLTRFLVIRGSGILVS